MDDFDPLNISSMEAKYDISLEVTKQQSLFPIDIIELFPNDQNSADMQFIGTGRDSRDYAIKTLSEGSGYIPACELFCYELAHLLHIPTPEYALVRLYEHNELAFGSVWQGASKTIASESEVKEFLTSKTVDQSMMMVISRIYGLDLFVNNIDRHFGNYLFGHAYKRKIAFAFDFSRAWMEIDYKGIEATVDDKESKTLLCSTLLKKFNRLDRSEALSTLDLITKIDKKYIEMILNKIPPTWLDDDIKSEVLTWWGGEVFLQRIGLLKEGVIL